MGSQKCRLQGGGIQIAEIYLEVRRAGFGRVATCGQAQARCSLHRAVAENHRVPAGFVIA